MKLHRFIGNFDLKGERLRIRDAAVVKQLRNVLRFRTGDEIILSDGDLNEALARISLIAEDGIDVKILKLEKNKNEPATRVILYCSVLKRGNFEFVAEKATEIGVKAIMPIIAERTVKLNFKKGRLEKIVKEAAEQSGRGIVPVLKPPVSFENAASEADADNLNMFLVQGYPSLNFTTPRVVKLREIGVWIGPEGGWSKEEIELAQSLNFKILSLGKLTLRSETAAIIASYLCLNGKNI